RQAADQSIRRAQGQGPPDRRDRRVDARAVRHAAHRRRRRHADQGREARRPVQHGRYRGRELRQHPGADQVSRAEARVPAKWSPVRRQGHAPTCLISRRAFAAAAAAVAAASALVRPAWAAGYPERIIKLIVPFAAGGPVAGMARLVGQYLSAKFGQSVIVENRPGAGGTLAAKMVAAAEPDGYTLYFASAGSLAISPSLYKNLGYDPIAAFAPVALVANHPQAMVVHSSVPVHSVRELIDYAKANLGKLNFGAAPGTLPQLMVELFCTLTGINMAFVPSKAAAL